jgi:hypothetical protein
MQTSRAFHYRLVHDRQPKGDEMGFPSDLKEDSAVQTKPWIAITWFAVWGSFQFYAVISFLAGTWTRPEAFPEEAYNALVYPDIFFIPLYFSAAVLLFRVHYLGKTIGLMAGGAMVYVMIYLLALSGFKGAINLSFDSAFLTANVFALLQLVKMDRDRQRNENT